jgi:microcin C transport system substrate-binding protein
MGADRLAYWNIFDRPKIRPRYDVGFETWWIDPKKVATLNREGRS